MNNTQKELTTHSIYCPKCGRLFQWCITEEPKYELVVLHLRCSDCGTSDALAVSRREFLENLLGGKEE
jgi:ribosomal protein S27AE